MKAIQRQNYLKGETSPYLLQHAENPVAWYPWCAEAFARAAQEDKPIFLSIGYSTCHWCHVMAHESFEDEQVAERLNQSFICIKVDKEERPDIDSIYMNVCQAFTGSGGWPTTVFLTSEQIPFFAGTYYPKQSLLSLLQQIAELWDTDRAELLRMGAAVVGLLNVETGEPKKPGWNLAEAAFQQFAASYDRGYGGFGAAPKFPAAHNLMFLLEYHAHTGNAAALSMAEKTLLQLYRGGIFDHIGYGFSRYSTDRYFLVPHFEKMLYDNALLMMAYASAYETTGNDVFRKAAEKTASYILREITAPQGGFYSAQDADSKGIEGKFYVFDYDEVIEVLGVTDGKRFNDAYGITHSGNFEGKNIPNRLGQSGDDDELEPLRSKLYAYRKNRTALHLDDKILTAWNGLAAAAFAMLYRVTGNGVYLETAERAVAFVEKNSTDGQWLFVSWRDGKRAVKGFLEDYAYHIFALVSLYEAGGDKTELDRAVKWMQRAVAEYYDREHGGFYLSGLENERLILRPKETYDGAMPSGNAVMAYNLVKLSQITGDAYWEEMADAQLSFLAAEAEKYPAGHSFFLLALSMYLNPPPRIVCVRKEKTERINLPLRATVTLFDSPSEQYPLRNGRTTYYVCRGKTCLPPVNALDEVLS